MSIVNVSTIYGQFYCQEDDMITRQLRRFSAHTRNEIALLRDVVPEGSTVIDVGAHIGTFALPFSQFVGQNGTVLAIEGAPEMFTLLEKNVSANNIRNIRTLNCVVSDRQANFEYVDTLSGNSGAGQFLEVSGNGDGDFTSIKLDDVWEAHLEKSTVGLLKIDVEGAELEVLNGATELISDCRPLLYVELNEDVLHNRGLSQASLLSYLEKMNYALYRNIGHRNSVLDTYHLVSLTSNESELPALLDVLAVCKNNKQQLAHVEGLVK